MIFVWGGLGPVLFAVVIYRILTGIARKPWFPAFERWCAAFSRRFDMIIVATASCGCVAFIVYAVALS